MKRIVSLNYTILLYQDKHLLTPSSIIDTQGIDVTIPFWKTTGVLKAKRLVNQVPKPEDVALNIWVSQHLENKFVGNKHELLWSSELGKGHYKELHGM